MSLWRRKRDFPVRNGPATKISVGVMGATGTVGQQLVVLLEDHPWFHLAWLADSERSEGRCFGELPWKLPGKAPESAAHRKVDALQPDGAPPFLFSALDAAAAGEAERRFAAAGHFVFSGAQNFRMDPLVPLVIPEVNAQHMKLVEVQQRKKRWSGAIITSPNCSTTFLAVALAALREFDIKRVVVTTLQALSGAGYPGVPAMDSVANVIPWIDGEEDKIETETQKILGQLTGDAIEVHPVRISAHVSRVPVLHGHMEMVSVEFGGRVSTKEVADAFGEFAGAAQALRLPSSPTKPIVVHDEEDRPQPRLDAESAHGMAVHVGRLRKCPVFDCKFVLVGHNTIRGAAGAVLLNAELMVAGSLFAGVQIAKGEE